ncbi:Protein CBR-GST-36 [Caenorhabditis briggsae]|uniref:Uncharacterized protein n=2 Tax=Caenorhabditis briggsae TaxID=6238 RepID=A0AAE9FB79_CAEBR|nr:Protein CBR-GST-36 [Caenorhabditis briggsae]ULT80380.1 hypothetical protein L3Y34_010743 [Caenorhabditis briggsae]UMM39690.1 hypothetical protein L5515_016628 [Caenorhabditis briggsae]CAP23107.1 Protein CBR-GST-36 [Caenorhabditis briggsae]
MPNYKLYYFDVRSRGEVIRLLFHLADEKFEDQRIQMEEWGVLKAEMPLGQVPVLEVDGVKIAQTTAILRYLGHQFHRAGTNAVDCARLDMMAEVIQEFMSAEGMGSYSRVLFGLISANKEQFFKEKVLPDVEKYAPLVEKFLLENGNNGLLLGDRETWVDVFAAETFSKIIDYGSPDALDAYPHILALINRVFNHPNIKKYVAQRKPTPA